MTPKNKRSLLCVLSTQLIFVLMMTAAYNVPVEMSKQTEIIFEDDFANNSNNWNIGSGENSESVIEDGKLKVESQLVPDSWNHTFLAPSFSAENVDISVDTQYTQGAPENSYYGVACQYQDEENYIWVVVRSIGTYSIQKQVDTEWSFLAGWARSALIDREIGATNNLRIVCSEGHITLFINGTLAADVEDSSLKGGSFRLDAAAYLSNEDDTNPVQMGFSNLVVREPLAWESPSGILFSESFDSTNDNWNLITEPTDYGYSDQIQDGELLANFESESWTWKALPVQLSDSDVSFDVTQRAGALNNYSFGALCRKSGDNYYDFIFSFDDEGLGYYTLGKNSEGTYEDLIDWTESTAANPGIGVTNRVRVVCSGSDLEMYVNGEQLFKTQDASLTTGGTAMRMSRYDNDDAPVTVAFDNLEVKYP